jgi:tetrahydromethanopterin S-methyltransferase subunit G
MELFFLQLEKYIDVRPSEAMTDVIVKIMVEVITILRIVTKEVSQGRTSMSFLVDFYPPKIDCCAERYLKILVGRKDVENALQRLDKLTQEEVRMAVAEALTISRDIDDTVKDVGKRLEGVDEKVRGVDGRVKDVDHTMKGVDSKVVSVMKGKLGFH